MAQSGRILPVAAFLPLCALATAPAFAQTALPPASGAPLSISADSDPLLDLTRQAESRQAFRDVIAAAVSRNPSVAEAEAYLNEARARRREAQMGLIPDLEIGFSARQSLARNFSDDPDNLIEQSRSRGRADATFGVQQPILDFGATSARIVAAGHRLRAAAWEIDASAERTALSAVAAWYDVFAYRALVELAEAFQASQREFRASVEQRIDSGVNARGDIARADSSIAVTGANLARYRRLAAAAEARYTELIGAPPAETLRAPAPDQPAITKAMAEYLGRTAPQVEAARSEANAAYDDSRAARAERLPQVTAGVEGGRYGLFDTDQGSDYDVRATVNVRQRFFAGTFARADAERYRADAVRARAYAVEEESAREAAIAWADVDALNAQVAALQDNYIASRQTRDVLAERFRVSRGTLFDVLQAEDAYFAVAGSFIQAVTERDAARYVLLARTGRLLDALGIDERGRAVGDMAAGDIE
ncbi:MAG: TolC family protein [Pacificimonas sp.]